jgi:hypothetical protein
MKGRRFSTRPWILVPENGVEPSRPCGHRILSPARLPVPPLGHGDSIASARLLIQRHAQEWNFPDSPLRGLYCRSAVYETMTVTLSTHILNNRHFGIVNHFQDRRNKRCKIVHVFLQFWCRGREKYHRGFEYVKRTQQRIACPTINKYVEVELNSAKPNRASRRSKKGGLNCFLIAFTFLVGIN